LRRKYQTQEGCPVAATLDVIGDRWTILILRDLAIGRSGKFNDLLQSLEGISPNLLSQRLKRLEREGVVEYRFTETGQQLATVIRALADWGIEHRLDEEQRAAAMAILGNAISLNTSAR
jgi:DNA-binding HxlR family transcriptional regulator